GEEGVDFGRCRRQASQVEAETAEQRAPVRLGRRGEFVFGELVENEKVDRSAGPGLWHRGGEAGRWWVGPRAGGPGGGPGSTRRDPALQLLDLCGGEGLAFRRHPLALLGCADAA